mmetsp:Transcript_419/g.1167  ORF Transcript_419/g.1167 Transcript_419/m.1167 type:complete len:387 (-) Transcript_419:97-1257(-)|eukprot:CAMPEP_0168725444 /NCGR_PEP_ID=MMETSP0724-20121128/4156_1 /TAXON_ID=265536 /ORGANISM="Amphiprora sp., Strain CCMP467" /LENGTH=386 /DNA_ID=CAMNT_0008772227 /DNA_START=109 /DNA_END=1269 /DNA_ORIENTATION=+
MRDTISGKNNNRRGRWPFLSLVIALLFLVATLVTNDFDKRASCGDRAISDDVNAEPPRHPNNTKLKIALISGFVTNPDPTAPSTSQKVPRIKPSMMEHMLNKVCYAKLHGYDFIFNSTAGFPDMQPSQYWLNYGTWHRVPHMMAALPKYDWIVYMDTDFVIQDMTTPLETFVKDWELHQLQNVAVFLPSSDHPGLFTFSAFVVMIRNSPFGRRMLENWWEFSQGLCPKGNFDTQPGEYKWYDSDQPGIWYSLAKTHSEFTKGNYPTTLCNETTGFLATKNLMGPELNEYFRTIQAKKGSQGFELEAVPKNQPILWSLSNEETRSGLGVQLNWGTAKSVEDWPHAFGLHVKKEFQAPLKRDLQNCVNAFRCFVNYTDRGVFRHGCRP